MPNFMAVLFSALRAGAAPGAAIHVPAAVTSVTSGGYWSSQGRNGSYRAIVVNAGFEHVTSRVFVEWIADPRTSREESTVVASVEPVLPFGQGIASLEARIKPIGSGTASLSISGVVSSAPEQHVSAVFILKAPGQVTIAGG